MKVMDFVAAALKREGVEFITGFPHNQLIDSCSEIGIRPIMTRTERVGLNMADGFSRMSGDKAFGVAAVQYGPGIENASGAIAQAFADSSSILVLPGGYDSHEQGVSPNFSASQSLGSISKAVMSLNYADRAQLMMQRAFGLMRSGKPGPVVVEIPDDLMTADVGSAAEPYFPARIGKSLADPADVEAVVSAIAGAKRPVLVVGRGMLHAGASDRLRAFAEQLCLPVMTTLAGKSAFPEDHPLALGTGGLSSTAMVDEFLRNSDLIIGLGTSFTKSHYTSSPPRGPKIIQITNDAQDVCKSFPISHLLLGDLRNVMQQLLDAASDRIPTPIDYRTCANSQKIQTIKRAFLTEWMPRLMSNDEPISPYRVVWEFMNLADRTRTVLTHDSGNPRDQIIPFYEAIVPHGYIGWGKSTQLGTGLGLTMGAKLAKPDWLAVNVMGDASFGMVGLDIETAVRCEIPILTIVFNNGLMGGYEHWLPIATSKHQVHLQGGNYTKVANALGVTANRVEKVSDLSNALSRAINHTREGRPALVEVLTRPEPNFPTAQAEH